MPKNLLQAFHTSGVVQTKSILFKISLSFGSILTNTLSKCEVRAFLPGTWIEQTPLNSFLNAGGSMVDRGNISSTIYLDIKLRNFIGEIGGLFNSMHCRFASLEGPSSSSVPSLDRFFADSFPTNFVDL